MPCEERYGNGMHPILILPKVCTDWESNYAIFESMFINLHIISSDGNSNGNILYSGMCNVKLVEKHHHVLIQCYTPDAETSDGNLLDTLAEPNDLTYTEFNDSSIWIDPSESPFVYNDCDMPALDAYAAIEDIDNLIAINQFDDNITPNIYNYDEELEYSPISSAEQETPSVAKPDHPTNFSDYEDNELECGVYLSQLSADIINEKETLARDERKFVELETSNEALKQLMSKDIQTATREQKTILFLGHNPESGQTVQNITINDPMLECIENGDVDNEVVIDETKTEAVPGSKKFQCNKCKRMFDHLATFKQHMVSKHRMHSPYDIANIVRFQCTECGKCLKNKAKLDQHQQAHGDPDLECNTCHKVFASKFTLRVHRKIHTRRYPCDFCTRSYATAPELYSHKAKAHSVFTCEHCSFTCNNSQDFAPHLLKHKLENKKMRKRSLPIIEKAEEAKQEVVTDHNNKKQDDELVLQKIRSIPLFRAHCNSKTRLYPKNCELCLKTFDRLSDLKRHLIEHVVRVTLSKHPVNELGVLNICCEICNEKVFTSVDKYKAHLREHAKLTLYKCTFCDKSFSDSSNFSKHKKIHGAQYLQCDLCQRKFNSKKMIIQHMDYHKKNNPIDCQYCGKVFYFKSSLNKHIKGTHYKGYGKYKCTFCSTVLDCLKKKWDHEWLVHNVRKVIIDCVHCGSKFRKISQLKKHALNVHNIIMPSTRKLAKLKASKNVELLEE